MENHGIFSQDLQQCRFSKTFKTNWTFVKQVQNMLKNHLHVHVQRYYWTKKDIFNDVLRIPGKVKKITQKGFFLGHWSFVGPGRETRQMVRNAHL